MKRWLASALLLLALVATAEAKRKRPDPTAAGARTDVSNMTEPERKQTAMALVAQARVLFDKGDFAPSVAKFEEAYRLFPVAKMFYNIGVTYEKLGKPDRAVCALERFVAEAPNSDAGLLAESKEKIARLQKSVGRVEVQAPAGSVLFVDGDERATAPAKEALCIEEGKRRVVALLAGVAPVGIDLDIKGSEIVKVSMDPATNTATLLTPKKEDVVAVPVAATPPPVTDGKQPLYKKWWLWTAVGGALVIGGAAAGLAIALKPVNVAAPAAEFGPYKVWP